MTRQSSDLRRDPTLPRSEGSPLNDSEGSGGDFVVTVSTAMSLAGNCDIAQCRNNRKKQSSTVKSKT